MKVHLRCRSCKVRKIYERFKRSPKLKDCYEPMDVDEDEEEVVVQPPPPPCEPMEIDCSSDQQVTQIEPISISFTVTILRIPPHSVT